MGSLHGYDVASRIPLRRLSCSPGECGRLCLERAAESALDRPGELTAWQGWDDAPNSHVALVRTDSGLIAWCSATGAFEIEPAVTAIRVANARLDDSWEHRLGTMAVPLLAAERGDLALHASAVAVDGRAVLFCGPSGRGKSVLALLAAGLGHRVVTEDGAVVTLDPGGARVWPGARGVRAVDGALAVAGLPIVRGNGARPPTVGRLVDLPPGLEASGPVRVCAICHLAERSRDLSVRGLAPSAAVAALVPSLIHAGGPAPLRAAFGLLARVVERVPAYDVTMPDGLAGAREAAEIVLAEVAS